MVDARPSPGTGLRHAVRLWKLVLAVWVASGAVFIPSQIVVGLATAPTMSQLPDGGLPTGDAELIALEILQPVVAPLAVALLSGCLALWVWTVAWHAGTVRWLLWSGSWSVSLSEIMGHGLVWWWRFARLSLVSGSVLMCGATGVALALGLVAAGSTGSATEAGWHEILGLLLMLVLIGLLVTCWLATLRGAWILGAADRRSAILAWLHGIVSLIRHPVASLTTLSCWAVPGWMLLVLPVALGLWFPSLRDGPLAAAVRYACGFGAALCWVGLFLSFAPVKPATVAEDAQVVPGSGLMNDEG